MPKEWTQARRAIAGSAGVWMAVSRASLSLSGADSILRGHRYLEPELSTDLEHVARIVFCDQRGSVLSTGRPGRGACDARARFSASGQWETGPVSASGRLGGPRLQLHARGAGGVPGPGHPDAPGSSRGLSSTPNPGSQIRRKPEAGRRSTAFDWPSFACCWPAGAEGLRRVAATKAPTSTPNCSVETG